MAARVLPPMLSATVEPATLVPVMVLATSEALTMSSLATKPITGAPLAKESTVMVRVPAALLLPAASVWVALKISVPWPMAVMSLLCSA